MPSHQPPVLAIVIDHDNHEDTQKCVEALRSQAHSRLSIFLVDNSDRPLQFSSHAQKSRWADLYVATENRGFAAACNMGIQWGLEQGMEFIWLVNNDLFVEPSTLSCLLKTMAQAPQIAGCSPKIVNIQDRIIGYAGGFQRNDLDYWLPRGVGETDQGQYENIEEIDWLSGGCALLRIQALQDVGPMDENFFLYYEDVDWGVRARKHGWKFLYVGTCKVRHHASQSTSGVKRYYYPRAYFLFHAKHYPKRLLPALRRYYHHALRPHLIAREWGEAFNDLKVYLGFLFLWLYTMGQK